MNQKNIRSYNNNEFSKEEAAEWLKEIDDRTKSSQTGRNSINELATEVGNGLKKSDALSTVTSSNKLVTQVDVTNTQQTPAQIKASLEGLTGTNRLDASAIKNLPSGGTGGSGEMNVQSDWNATTGDALILNKPTIPSAANFVSKTGNETIGGQKTFNDNAVFNENTSFNENVDFNGGVSGMDYQDLVNRPNPLVKTNTTTITLNNTLGDMYVNSANSATNYTVSITSAKVGVFAKILINAATEPTVNSASTGKIKGATFLPNTNMHLVIYTDNGSSINYYFLEI